MPSKDPMLISHRIADRPKQGSKFGLIVGKKESRAWVFLNGKIVGGLPARVLPPVGAEGSRKRLEGEFPAKSDDHVTAQDRFSPKGETSSRLSRTSFWLKRSIGNGGKICELDWGQRFSSERNSGEYNYWEVDLAELPNNSLARLREWFRYWLGEEFVKLNTKFVIVIYGNKTEGYVPENVRPGDRGRGADRGVKVPKD
jgi:hypothetical protein